jgi:hypothetical protein
LDKKLATYGIGRWTSTVAYVIVEKIVYFTQVDGVFSSINGAENIIITISDKETINWREYRWVDIQQTPRYSKACQDEIILFDDSNIPEVNEWKPFKVSDEVFITLVQVE